MHERTPTIGAAWRAALTCTAIILFLLALPYAAPHAAAGGEAATSPKVHELVTLLADPTVQEWLKREDEAKTAAAAKKGVADESVSHALDGHIVAIREHIAALARAAPDLPNQFWRGRARVTADLGENGRVKALLLLAAFIGLGSTVEWLFRKATQRVRARLDTVALGTINDRLRVVGLHFAFAIGLVAAFALGSIGPFLAFDWPPLLREMLFGYLVAFLAVRIANVVVGHFLLAPDHERFQIIPVGFGAQTFVRDVIAGMFYLMDDAFRVGEYIQASHYKGTIEGFSIRSVKLRHHRGPVFTVPFSLLGAVGNMSRDWVIDKISIGVTYDSDFTLAKKLIKQIGLDLTKEPEFASLIIEPLKM